MNGRELEEVGTAAGMVWAAGGRTRIWRCVDTGPLDASTNMALDEAIASHVMLGSALPTLRFYSWLSPSVTIGFFQRHGDIDTAFCEAHNIPVVRRPTGGRAILHCGGLTYSFSARTVDHEAFGTLFDSYALLASAFLSAFGSLGIDASVRNNRRNGRALARTPSCFRTASFGEIVAEGRKIIGSAQRRYRGGFLQQGSVPFRTDPTLFAGVFPAEKEIPAGLDDLGLGIGAVMLKDAVSKALGDTCGVTLVEMPVTEEEWVLARRLLEQRYRSPQWLHRR